MSAFVVSHAHIDALLTFADMKRLTNELAYHINRGGEKLSLTHIGRILLAENERSVGHRYPDCVPGYMPGESITCEAITYRFKTYQKLFRMQHAAMLATVIKACHCYDYQACETDDYESSIAHRIIRAIEARAISALPHYEEAPWGIDEH